MPDAASTKSALHQQQPPAVAAVRPQVRTLLQRSPAFASLTPDKQQQLTHDLEQTIAYLAAPEGISAFTLPNAITVVSASAASHPETVDLPDFVDGLIKGVFQTIVDSSVQQMKAYSDLLANAAKTVSEFVSDHPPESKRKLAVHRQQLLAGIVLMGINRIVVTDGSLKR